MQIEINIVQFIGLATITIAILYNLIKFVLNYFRKDYIVFILQRIGSPNVAIAYRFILDENALIYLVVEGKRIPVPSEYYNIDNYSFSAGLSNFTVVELNQDLWDLWNVESIDPFYWQNREVKN